MPINTKLNSIILLENFNNYFNRKIILLPDVDSYISNYDYNDFKDINFNPNDDVSTEIVFNFDKVNIDPDYLLVCENAEDPDDDNPDIISRWFVLESTRTRSGQYHLKLRRDVIADYFNDLRTAPIFVQKAWVKESDPFIFNSEGMNFNQIKVGERLLKDQTKSAWLVAYIERGSTGRITASASSGSIEYITLSEISDATGISQATLTAMLNTDNQFSNFHNIYTNTSLKVLFEYNGLDYPVSRWKFNTDDLLNFTYGSFDGMYWFGSQGRAVYHSSGIFTQFGEKTQIVVNNIKDQLISNNTGVRNNLESLQGEEIITLGQKQKLEEFISGRAILYGGNFYTMRVVLSGNQTTNNIKTFNWKTYASIKTSLENANISYFTMADTGEVSFYYDRQPCSLMLEAFSQDEATLVLSSSRNTLLNREYDMVCMPYNDLELSINASSTSTYSATISGTDYWYSDGTYHYYRKTFYPILAIGEVLINAENSSIYQITNTSSNFTIVVRSPIPWLNTDTFTYSITLTTMTPTATSQGAVCRRIASAFGLTLGASCYDIQLLPYCPLTDFVYQGGVDISNLNAGVDYDYILDSDNDPVGICFYCSFDSFQVYINESIRSEEDSLKIENECHSYRLVSPNYQGTFDFSVAKNGGSVPSFTAFCTYKPYTPYIKVAPFFMNLYGAEYGDNRGLICGGDFSISRIDSAWVQYQLNNKNYQNIFNRDIQNLDFQQSIEMRLQVLGASVGAITGAGQGASTGFLASGSPYGAIAGAVLGGSASAVGGIIDTNILAQQQREARNYAIDKYNYQLGNIKALPHTLTKVSAWDINSKIFPFVEFYSCTDEEKEALKLKLQYESMTTMRIGTINEFILPEEHYFKGELIRCENIASETHLIMAIYEELLKGVYINE